MIKIEVTEQEALILREALMEYKFKLRTIHSPLGDQELTEDDFLSRDISENRRKNYLFIKSLQEEIASKIK